MLSRKRVQWGMMIALLAIICIRLFYKLGVGTLMSTDEAWYAINANEMLKADNWLVPTLRYQVDYGSKPPLGIWSIMFWFKVLGINTLGLRMYSAIAGLLTIVLICGYLYQRYDLRYSIVAAAAFPALWQCFEFHMFRAGDMDALFCLFYAIAIFALAEVHRGKSWMIILYGAAVGLGFMTKSMHVVVFIVVGVLYLPVIFKNLKIKEVIWAAVVALLPAVIWVLARARFDGLKYIKCITLGEAGDQTRGGITLLYLRDISHEKVTWVLAGVLLTRVVLYFVKCGAGLSVKKVLADLKAFVSRKYLSILAYVVPIALYTLAGHYMMWYIDPSYIAIIWIIAIETVEVLKKIDFRVLRLLFAGVVVYFCVFYACVQIVQYSTLGTGGRAVDQFKHDIAEFVEGTSGEYSGYDAYIAYDRTRFVGDQGHWELDYVFLAESTANLQCLDGGVYGFLEDEDSILVLDGELWDRYADVLTGYVFLEQNTFYVICHDRYEDLLANGN
ncbi:ArnT family glycosyltransferase [Butyrivibrio sp. VCB2006]|uniref:ArnT family glycosyltransferase n=1 Tax=Butyrivibrio sp. VCB2006 TaxID=1280679 RepID=UPI0004927A25|nr:glycosyltransferase family 39 protein [Butyrivibrio sp. VCB2006]